MRERYVLLGLARARADWFRRVSQWTTSAALPAEFVRCVSVQELTARLASGRTFSAALVDGSIVGFDRDVLAQAQDAGCPVIVVDDGRGRPWSELGASAVVPGTIERGELLEVLAAHTAMVDAAAEPDHPAHIAADGSKRRGVFIGVTGPGGTGASTVAVAAAQGLAAPRTGSAARTPVARTVRSVTRAVDRRSRGTTTEARKSVLLADLCRNADQAMLHDSRVVVPGIQEVVEAHRSGTPWAESVVEQTFAVAGRDYRLLLGLRRPRHWVALRPRALEATLDTLQRAFDRIVCDFEPDLEGEEETGSPDIEERHLMARAAATRASVVLAVGAPGMKGLFSLVRVIGDLAALGVPANRIVPVLNRAPRRPRDRAEIAASLADLLRASLGETSNVPSSPVFLPRRPVDTALRDGVPLPRPLPDLIAGAVRATLARRGAVSTEAAAAVPVAVAPGSLGASAAEGG